METATNKNFSVNLNNRGVATSNPSNRPSSNDDTVARLANDANYIRKSSSIINEALQKGADVLQLSDGNIFITEVKTVTYKYHWNNEKSRFERANSGKRTKRPRKNKNSAAVAA